MHIHILGICGTFMGGLAVLARQLGLTVTGSDLNVYPPMSTQLEDQGITLKIGYSAANLEPRPDLVVIGNALSRGNPEVEAALDAGLRYVSGPEWLFEQVLMGRWVVAVAGTHGKTTTTSMVAQILDYASCKPGFLIGGIPQDFGISARLGQGSIFVVEADEYDSAFFDKRSKFVHYRPRTLVLNNLEYDHADIFPDLAAIQRQFHHLVRTVPGNGMLIAPAADTNVRQTLEMGCWTPIEWLGDGSDCNWRPVSVSPDGSAFGVEFNGRFVGRVTWNLTGRHNVDNGIAAIAAAAHVGVEPSLAVAALSRFQGVKRRMELRAVIAGISLYDDFAHHPTAIATTLAGLRAKLGSARVVAVLEPRSNTMRLGVHAKQLADSLRDADEVIIFQPPDLKWNVEKATRGAARIRVFRSIEAIVDCLTEESIPGDHIVLMSNGGFGGVHGRLETALRTRYELLPL